jgi:hypothetical protein
MNAVSMTILIASLCAADAVPAEASAPDSAVASISQYGVTWTFDRSVVAGRFVTGDWWVVGPVTVRSVSPTPTADRHGSVVNPSAGDRQGYDRRMAHFDPALRATFPVVLQPGDALVSVASVEKSASRRPTRSRVTTAAAPCARRSC